MKKYFKKFHPVHLILMIPTIIAIVLASMGLSAQDAHRFKLDIKADPLYYERQAIHSMFVTVNDTTTVKEGFAFLRRVATGPTRFRNHYVIKNDTAYFRYWLPVFNRTFIVEGGKKKRVKI